ncbi:DUF4251 domain-containing protein [Pedobacter endophyticus]|nr:DUF4251 domain-containing protein [Pedobacter endophyticus]
MMKHLKKILTIGLLLFVTQTYAQTDKETTVRIVENKTYNFVANSALPMANNDISRIMSTMPGGQSGSMINLTGSQYDVKVTKDSVIAYLPYYGRAYSAPYNASEGGIKFTSKDFTYKKSKNKKGAYTIQINTKDGGRENYRFTLNISQNGYATLTASSVNKQPIVYNGYLDEPKKKD